MSKGSQGIAVGILLKTGHGGVLGREKRAQKMGRDSDVQRDSSGKTRTKWDDPSDSGKQRRTSAGADYMWGVGLTSTNLRGREHKTSDSTKVMYVWEFSEIVGKINTEKIRAFLLVSSCGNKGQDLDDYYKCNPGLQWQNCLVKLWTYRYHDIKLLLKKYK